MPVFLTAGDCFFLPRGLPFCLATDLSLTPVDFPTLLSELKIRGAISRDQGADRYLVGDILLRSLPPIVRIRKDSDKAAMRWSLERVIDELRDPQPGGALIAQQLAYVMLVQALRLHVADGAKGTGWLFALADEQMSRAITCMHEAPAHQWTLKELAERVGMSRSIFALKFKQRLE